MAGWRGVVLSRSHDKYLAVPSISGWKIRTSSPASPRPLQTTTRRSRLLSPGIDYAALDRLVPFADNLALRSAASALESAGLTPVSARPMVGHTEFITVAIGADGAEQEQRRTLLDTRVSYRLPV